MVFESLDNIVPNEPVCRKRDTVKTVTSRTVQTPTTVTSEPMKSSSSSSSSSQKNVRRRTRTNSGGVVRSKQSAFWELAGAMFVYGMCISLPTILGVMVRLYQNTFLSAGNDTQNRTWASYSTSTLNEHTPWYRSSPNNPSLHLTHLPHNILNVLQRWAAAYLQTNALSDVQFVIMTSIALALFRVLLIHFLVPKYIVPTRVEALVRCKSTHLLSAAEYHFDTITNFNNDGIVASPRRFSRKLSMPQMPEGMPLMPDIDNMDNIDGNSSRRPTLKRKSNSRKRVLEHLKGIWDTSCYSFRLTLGMTNTPTNSIDASQALRLRSAPRYATAIFRFSCCALSCTWAILHFHSANFWPIWVGGITTAQTKNCWDLSGSVAALHGGASLDSDFDDQNSSLRYFFLSQASYQMHSLCFHALSMVLLAFCGGGGIFVSVRTSMKSYFKPIVEHLLSITLIISAFLFSGSRRLGAIAIFALEASSLFLQLLQICINAPVGSRLRRPWTIKIVHRFMTIPVFIYCRFFVVPFIVLYSAMFESRDWIRQIERAMAPGCGALIYYFFNGLLLVVMGSNFVSLRRLLFHPHVRQILS